MLNKIVNLILVFALLVMTTGQSFAKSDWYQKDENNFYSHSHYTNASGNLVHSPTKTRTNAIPSGASAKCSDGSYSFSQHRRGTCSHHGGVSSWL
jgi:uncharacterized protein YgiB involved in biofilm formation